MRLVVDASVAIKWLIDEPDSEVADLLLDGAHDFLAPELIIAEVLNAAWRRRRLGEIADARFYGGYQPEAALLIRQARDRGYDLELIGSDALVTEYFWHVAGPAAVGVRFVSMADPRTNAEAAPVVEKFRAEGYEPEGFTLYSYAAVEVWAQAVEKTGTFETDAVADALRTHEFDTVLGRIGFDDKGDVYGYEPFTWYVWQDGDYAPAADLGD